MIHVFVRPEAFVKDPLSPDLFVGRSAEVLEIQEYSSGFDQTPFAISEEIEPFTKASDTPTLTMPKPGMGFPDLGGGS